MIRIDYELGYVVNSPGYFPKSVDGTVVVKSME